MKPAMPVDINETTQRTLDSIESMLVLEVASVKDALAAAYKMGRLDGMIAMTAMYEKQYEELSRELSKAAS